MRVQCRHCNATAKIGVSKTETAGLKVLYVSCQNCRSQQVWHLSWSHDTAPPNPDYKALAVDALERLPPDALAEVLDRYRSARPTLPATGQ